MTAPLARRIDDATLVRWLPTVLGLLVFAACAVKIRQRWFIPGWSTSYGYTTAIVEATVAGTDRAPNQYRPLMPWVQVLLADGLAVPLPSVIVLTDILLLGVLVVLLHRLSIRLGHPWLILPAAGAWALMVVKIDHWHPEVMLLSVLVTAAILSMLDTRPRLWSLLAIAVVMCGARTDYAAGLGLVVLAVGVARRDRATAAVGVAVGSLAVVATGALLAAYPQARYVADVVQLDFNLHLGSWAMIVPLYGPLLLVPLVVALRGVVPPLWPALLWFGIQFLVTFVVGQVHESRIFLPLAPAIGIAAALAWLELHRRAARRAAPSRELSSAS